MKKTVKQSKKLTDLTLYKVSEAVARVKKYTKENFDPTVELHIALNTDPKKQEQYIRFSLTLPHGTGKTKKVAAFSSTKVEELDLQLGEEDIEKIEKGAIKPKVDFDVLVAEPKFMPKLAKVAKILGPLGMMPNPRTGTVSDDIENTVKQIKKGKVEVKTEKDAAVIHTIIGKSSFEENMLVENLREIVTNIKQNKPAKLKVDLIKSAYVCSSMGRSYKIDLNDL